MLDKKTKAFVEKPERVIATILNFASYSPDRDPDEMVWKHANPTRWSAWRSPDREDFKLKVRSSMRRLQNNTAKIRAFDQEPSLQYARESRATNELTNKSQPDR